MRGPLARVNPALDDAEIRCDDLRPERLVWRESAKDAQIMSEWSH
jgi:hypothetical protein